MSSLGDRLQEFRPYWVKALLADGNCQTFKVVSFENYCVRTVYAHIFFELIRVLFM